MTAKSWLWVLVIVLLGSFAVLDAADKEPVFLSWLVENDPGDQTIREYWGRFENGELDSEEMIDLGTMLFYRGYPRDAITLYKASLDIDKKQYEPWFRIGLVEHQQGNYRQARTAYKKSLDILKGQGWCNFYLGLLEEHEGNSQKAMSYYQAAFKYAPELASPDVNPEMNSSDLSLGAWLLMTHQRAFQNALPMPFMQPTEVKKVRSSYMPARTPTPAKNAPVKSSPTPMATEDPDETGRSEKGELKSAPTPVPVVVPVKAAGSKSGATGKKSTTGGRRSSGAVTKPKPTPSPRPVTDDDMPYGLPSTRSVSSEAYPGF